MRVEKVCIYRVAEAEQARSYLEVEWDVEISGDEDAKSEAGLNLSDYELWKVIHRILGWDKRGELGHSEAYVEETAID
jgi:hypothetical protein